MLAEWSGKHSTQRREDGETFKTESALQIVGGYVMVWHNAYLRDSRRAIIAIMTIHI